VSSSVGRSFGSRSAEIQLPPTTILAGLCLLSMLSTAAMGTLAGLMFLVFGSVLVLRYPKATLSEFRIYRALWLIAGWSLTTVFWSQYPGLTIRYGLLLAATFCVAIAMANRLSPLSFLKAALIAFLISGTLSLIFHHARADGEGWVGVFGSKNALASAASILFLLGAAAISDGRLVRHWRWIGLLATVEGGVLLVKAHSVGTTFAALVAVAALGLILLLHRTPQPARLVLWIFGALVLGVIVIFSSLFADQLSHFFENVTGKDATLTGRTELWARAFEEIRHRPLQGSGFHAVWVEGNPLAEEMWAKFGIVTKTGFHFHNTFISNAVEVGLIGVALQVLPFGFGFVVLLSWAQKDMRAETLFLAIFMVRQLVLSMSEVVFFVQFDAASVLTIIAIAYAIRYRREMK
jgi:exopolysaccharide production protein ExoQ